MQDLQALRLASVPLFLMLIHYAASHIAGSQATSTLSMHQGTAVSVLYGLRRPTPDANSEG